MRPRRGQTRGDRVAEGYGEGKGPTQRGAGETTEAARNGQQAVEGLTSHDAKETKGTSSQRAPGIEGFSSPGATETQGTSSQIPPQSAPCSVDCR